MAKQQFPMSQPAAPTPPTIPEGHSAPPQVLGNFGLLGAQFSGLAWEACDISFCVESAQKQPFRGPRVTRESLSPFLAAACDIRFRTDFARKRPWIHGFCPKTAVSGSPGHAGVAESIFARNGFRLMKHVISVFALFFARKRPFRDPGHAGVAKAVLPGTASGL
jgi:hypothetical protein